MSETTTQPQFQIGEVLGSAWDVLKNNVGVLVGATALIGLINIVGNWFTVGLASIVIGGPLWLGFVALGMGLLRRQPTDFAVLFSGFSRFLPAFMANLLITIFAVVGGIFCVIPGIFVTIVYMLTFYYMFDKGLDFWPAMEASRKTVMGNFGPWFLLWLVILGINLVGLIPCGLGLLLTGPLSILMLGVAYDKVEGHAGLGETNALTE